MNRAVIYARFSSDRQNETSVEAQVRACKEYAAKNKLKVVGQYVDEAISGKGSMTNKRASYQKMLKDSKKQKFDTILIHKYDRIARNLGEHVNLAMKLQDVDVNLIAVAQDFGDSKEGKLMRSIQWVLSEYYIDNLADETRKGLKEVALKGLHNGGVPPFGYDIVDQQYVINPVEAAYVQRMFECALLRTGYKDLIEEMKLHGITGKRGKPINGNSIHEILHNEKYTGVYIYSPVEEKNRADRRTKPNAIRVENAVPQIIERATWEKVQEIMNERRQTGKKASYWCSGLVYCGCCGAKMHAQKSVRKGHTYYYYVCKNHCGNPGIKVDWVDKCADIYINEVFSPENRREISKAFIEYNNDERKMIKEFEETRKKKIAEKQKEVDALMNNMSSGALPLPVITQISEKMERLLKEIDDINAAKPIKQCAQPLVEGWLDSLLDTVRDELPKVLIEQIKVKTNEIEVISTLTSLVNETGCGGQI